VIVDRTMMRIARRCRREYSYHRSPAERRDLRAYMIKSARRWRRLAWLDPTPLGDSPAPSLSSSPSSVEEH